MNIDIQLDKGVKTPKYATPGSSGFDLQAIDILKMYKDGAELPHEEISKRVSRDPKSETIVIGPGEVALFSCGFKIAIPYGYELQVRSRSGTSLKRGLVVLNQPGTIDSDYRGTVGMIIKNTTDKHSVVTFGEALAQVVICPIERAYFNIVEDLPDTKRGAGGFGSTGNRM